MVTIRFRKLTVQNFKSIGEEVTIDFESLKRVTLIEGVNRDVKADDGEFINNGSGKSTIIDAIMFALYGRQLGSSNNRDLVNRTIGSRLRSFSRLEFTANGVEYVSEAFMNFKGKSDPTVGFTLKVGDSEPVSRNTAQMKKMIEEQVIGCPFDLFRSSVTVASSSYQNFYDMTRSQKVAYVDQLFQLQVFGELLKMARADLRSDTVEYNSLNMARGHQAEQLQDVSLKSSTFAAGLKDRSDRIATAITMKEAAVRAAEDDLSKIPEPADVTAIQRELLEANNQAASLTVKMQKCQSASSALRSRSSELERSCSRHKEVLDILCDACLDKADRLLDISRSKEEIAECARKVEVLGAAYDEAAAARKELEERARKMNTEIEESRSRSHRREMLENQLSYLRKELDDLRAQLSSEQSSENPFSGLVDSLKSKLADMDVDLSDKLGSIRLRKFIEFVFSDQGAKSAILADVARNVSRLVRHYLKRLGADYSVEIDSSFGAKFMTPSGESEFCMFSSGERQKITMATMLAFRDVIVGNRISSDLLILDEMLDSALDGHGVASIVSSLVSMVGRSGSRLMIVSHNPVVRESLASSGVESSVVTAVKQDGVTRYEVG